MKLFAGLLFLSTFFFSLASSAAQPEANYDLRRSLQYGTHDGVALTGDLYVPKAAGAHPVLVAVHGGDWQFADAQLYQYWGPYLAQRGYAVFAINYRLTKANQNLYPAALNDVRAAVQFLRERGASMQIDPNRIGLMGDSAGAHLAALAALTADQAAFSGSYADDVYARASSKVKVCVGIYGVYDMAAQWQYDSVHDASDNIAQMFLGTSLADNRRVYFDASPLSYVTRGNNQTAFFLAWGSKDDRVDSASQSGAFAKALQTSGFSVQSQVLPGAPHYWASDEIKSAHSYPGLMAPRLLKFLQEKL
ncbi:alpha/beta hydrolase [Undibacterium parvum]|nr:alpha/beta hydrolase [Undibacterium parvum]